MITLFFNQVDSTQNIAKSIAEKTSDEFAVIARQQISGRGRRGRSWFSPLGGLYISIVFRKVKCLRLTSLAVAALIANFLEKEFKVNVKVKWPNDILINNKKIGGILCEASIKGNKLEYIIIGIGLNVNIPRELFPIEFRSNTISLIEIVNSGDLNLEEIAGKLINEIIYVKDWNCNEILIKWLKYDCTIGRKVEVISDNIRFTGIARGIDFDGSLIIELSSGERLKINSSNYTIRILS